jgi:chromosome partitioning protein
MKRVVFNQKGGVGKTSIACNLAAISAANGQRTLVIDLDTQYNTSHYLLGNEAPDNRNMAELLDQSSGLFSLGKKAAEYACPTPWANLHVIPASEKLSDIEHKLESRYKIFKLRDALTALEKEYDEIYIDTPPALNFYTKSALIGADRLLIPFDCDSFSRQSLEKVTELVVELAEDHNPNLLVEGVIVNQFQPRARFPKQLVEELQAEGYPVIDEKLSSSVRMRESHFHCKPLIHYAPKHALTEQFVALYQRLSSNALSEQSA